MALGQELTTPTPALARPANSPKIPPTPPHVPPRVQASPSPLDAVRARGSPGGVPEARQSGRAPGNARTDFNPPPKTGGQTPSPSAGQPMAAPASSRPGEALSIRLLPRRGEDGGGAGEGNGAASCSLKPINSFGTALATQREEEALNSWPIRPR